MLLLNCIVGEMPIDIGGIVVKLFAAGAEVTLFVPVGFQVPTIGSHQGVTSNIKFTVFV